jgi:hypothetical protein
MSKSKVINTNKNKSKVKENVDNVEKTEDIETNKKKSKVSKSNVKKNLDNIEKTEDIETNKKKSKVSKSNVKKNLDNIEKTEDIETTNVNETYDKPKKNKTAYMLYILENRKKYKEENPDLNQKDISKYCLNKWREIINSKSQQDINYIKILTNKANKDKIRYNKEMELYLTNNNILKPIKKVKDPNYPKKPKNAYQIYLHAQYYNIKFKNPRLNTKEINLIIKNNWDKLDVQSKNNYIREEQYYLKKYEIEIDNYNNKEEIYKQLTKPKKVKKDKTFFSIEKRKELKTLNINDVNNKWNSLQEHDKKKYKALHEIDKIRYNYELNKYNNFLKLVNK